MTEGSVLAPKLQPVWGLGWQNHKPQSTRLLFVDPFVTRRHPLHSGDTAQTSALLLTRATIRSSRTKGLVAHPSEGPALLLCLTLVFERLGGGIDQTGFEF